MKLVLKLFSYLVFAIFLFEGTLLFGQNPSQIDVLTTEQGLSFRRVISIEQDANGFMWFTTNQGINRYDGYHFKVYDSYKNNPNFIEEDKITGNTLYDKKQNLFWYLANDKLFALQLATDSVISYNETHNIKGKVLRIHQTADGGIWIVTDDYWTTQNESPKQYLQKLSDRKFVVKASISRNNRGFTDLTSDTAGNIWWSTTNDTREYTNTGDFIASYDLDCYNFYGSTMHYVTSFFDSNNRHYFFPKEEGGIKIFQKETKTFQNILDVPHQILHAIEDNQNTIWFAGSKSLYQMNCNGDFTDYTPLLKERFDFSEINDLFIDATNLLWIATDNGLFKIRKDKRLFNSFLNSEKQEWGNTMRGIFEDHKGNLFAFSESADKLVFKSPIGIIDTLHLKTEAGNQVKTQYAANFFVLNEAKNIAFTTAKDLLKIDLETGNTIAYNSFSPNLKVYGPNAISKLSDGRLIFGFSLSRLTLFNPETEKSEAIFKNSEIYTDFEPLTFFKEGKQKNIVWVGTQYNGLLKVNLEGHIEKSFDRDSNPSIANNYILVIEEDKDGSLWIGTYGGGLLHISADEKTIKNYTKTNGLSDNNIVGILTDEFDNLWISTYNGLSYFDKKTETFLNYYMEDGLSNNEFNYSSFYKASNNTFYFGGMNGVTSFTSDQILKKEVSPKLKILGVSGYESNSKQEYNIDLSLKDSIEITISPYNQYFQVNWTLPNYFHTEKNTYSTKLEGYEDRWFFQGNTASIRYNQLPAGSYVLKVKGADARGNKTSEMLSIPITVQQIFYKQWWFILLIALLLVGIAYAIFKYRLNQVLAMERLRTKISSDLHDDVGSLLSGLAMQTELLEMNASEADKSKLQKITNISRNAISQMRDLVWSIDSRRATSNDLIEHMHELAEELLMPREIAFNIDTSDVKYGAKKLSAEVKQNLFLIYKEAITNILRHSDATFISIHISNETKTCSFVIKDNGSSKENYTSTGFGMANMKMRAEAIGGTVHFEMKDGFTVRVNLPFNL